VVRSPVLLRRDLVYIAVECAEERMTGLLGDSRNGEATCPSVGSTRDRLEPRYMALHMFVFFSPALQTKLN